MLIASQCSVCNMRRKGALLEWMDCAMHACMPRPPFSLFQANEWTPGGLCSRYTVMYIRESIRHSRMYITGWYRTAAGPLPAVVVRTAD